MLLTMAGAAADALPPPRYNKYIGYTLYTKLYWFSGHPDPAAEHACPRFSNYIVVVFSTFIRFVVS